MSEVNFMLKDGSMVSLQGFKSFAVRGIVVYSHFNTALTKKELEFQNRFLSKGLEKETSHLDKEYVNIPFRKIVLTDVSIVKKHENLTDAEKLAMDRFYFKANSSGNPGIVLKTYNPEVRTYKAVGDMVESCSFDDELAPGSEVICRGNVFIGNYGKPVTRLVSVTSIGEPQYLDRSKYQKKAGAA